MSALCKDEVFLLRHTECLISNSVSRGGFVELHTNWVAVCLPKSLQGNFCCAKVRLRVWMGKVRDGGWMNPVTQSEQISVCGIVPTARLIHDLILGIWVYLLWPPARRVMKCVMKYSCCCSRIIGLNNLSARHLDNYLQSKKISHILVIVSNGNEMQKDCKTGVIQHANVMAY